MNNLILVDTSYTSFYRFNATNSWMKLAHKEIENPIESDIFLEKYDKMYLTSITKLVGKKIFNDSKIIFCMDSPRKNLWRTSIKPDYKEKRIPITVEKIIFNHTYKTIIPKIIEDNSNISKMRIDKLEADDIIAIICRYYQKQYPNIKIYLISADNDFLQLGRKNLFFINYRQKKIVELTEDEAKYKLHEKILLGDTSDNIKGVFLYSKINNKIKKEFVESIDKFNEFINKKIENNEIIDKIKKKYLENSTLIDFTFIPIKYQNIVIKNLQ